MDEKEQYKPLSEAESKGPNADPRTPHSALRTPHSELILGTDDTFLEHDPGEGHVESRARLETLYDFLRTYERRDRFRHQHPREATGEDLRLVHTARLLKQVEQTAGQSHRYLDPDTVTSARSHEAARRAVGAVLESVDRVFAGDARRAFDFLRPPGHHAEPDRAMGFCLFNNVAVGAAYARRRYGLSRVLLVDFDVHHGNGTQEAFYETPEVLYVSTHQYPFYPGTGAREETGRGKGAGYTLNFPLPAGTGDAVYARIFQEILDPVADQYRPELVIVSAGFDPYFADPLANMRVTPAGFQFMARRLNGIAGRHAGGRILFALEGGYSLQGLRESVGAVVDELVGEGPAQEPAFATDERSNALVQWCKQSASAFWKL